MSTDETETRTLEDVSFETYQIATLAIERQIDEGEDALSELAEKWNEANARGDEDE